jgi:hypothetical protein
MADLSYADHDIMDINDPNGNPSDINEPLQSTILHL